MFLRPGGSTSSILIGGLGTIEKRFQHIRIKQAPGAGNALVAELVSEAPASLSQAACSSSRQAFNTCSLSWSGDRRNVQRELRRLGNSRIDARR